MTTIRPCLQRRALRATTAVLAAVLLAACAGSDVERALSLDDKLARQQDLFVTF